MKRLLLLFAFLSAVLTAPGVLSAEPAKKPNIILILADDVGFSDLGCYGSEIATPNLDRLAATGLRFTQFYNCARCCPSRACLLTGQYPHAVNFPEMSGSLPPTCVTIPEVLREAGYRTYMVGKWHLGNPNPVERGFDEFYGMLGGFNSCWVQGPYSRLPKGRPVREYTNASHGVRGTFYSTDAFTDYSLDFIGQARQSKEPYFLYLAYNAAHFPLHAPKEEIEKYAKLYEQGWDAIREKRYARLKQLGILDERWPLSPRSEIPKNPFNGKTGWADKVNPAWDSLDADRRADLARRMAIYAAMIDRMDQGVGRIVSDLEKNGELDSTAIFFLSDNGACAEWDPWGFDGSSGPNNILHRGAEIDAMGGPATYISYGSGWANACNTPFRLYKHYNHEGGIATPFIVHWPAGIAHLTAAAGAGPQIRQAGGSAVTDQPAHLIDLLPTIAGIAGAPYPKEANGAAIMPEAGVDLLPAFEGKPLPERQIFWEHEGSRAVREGKWKLVALGHKPWELYDMENDRVELNNLAEKDSALAARLSQAWDAWATKNWPSHFHAQAPPASQQRAEQAELEKD